MSRTTCYFHNNTSHPIRVVGYRGSDWGGTIPIDTIIQSGATQPVGRIGDPGHFETPHWGWIYLKDDVSGSQIQLYINKLGHDPDASIGYRNNESSHDTPNPSPFPLPGDGGWQVDQNKDVLYTLNQTPNSINLTNWMKERVGNDKCLRQICLPGTHDSGTCPLSTDLAPQLYDLEKFRPVYEKPESVEAIDAVRNILEKKLSNDAILDIVMCAVKPLLPRMGPEIMRRLFTAWSQATELTIEEQLVNGIRYLDLRVCAYEDALYTFHGFLGPKVNDILQQIKTWVQNVQGEIVFIHASHMAFGGNNKEAHERFIKSIESILGDSLFPYKPNQSLVQTTFGEMRINGTGSRIVFLYDDDYWNNYVAAKQQQQQQPQLWPLKDLFFEIPNHQDSAGGTSDLTVLQSDIQMHVQAFMKALPPNNLLRIGWSLTPQEEDITWGFVAVLKDYLASKEFGETNPVMIALKKIIGSRPTSLRDLADRANQMLPSFIEQNKTNRINLIAVDFCERSKLVSFAVMLTELLLNSATVEATNVATL